ncbi:hypothetical protein [Selenomonas ruminantium]|uniref:hypothetical protein n=1 Tax=Selenomonas ruminantium TaxID=971 RepID=UPI001E4EE377|nr:hypothetical protein [Selenomonas ruminantium]
MKKEGEQLLQSVSPSFHHLNYFFFSFFGDFFPEGKEISILSMSKGGTGMILIGGTGTGTFSILGCFFFGAFSSGLFPPNYIA